MYRSDRSSQRRSEIISGVLCLDISAVSGCSKEHGTLCAGSPYAIAFFQSRNWTSTHSLPAMIAVCLLSWYRANFSTSVAPWSLLQEMKKLFFFEKSGMSFNKRPSKEVQLHIFFFLGLGRNPGLCFIEPSLQAVLRPVNVQEYVREMT